LFGYATIRAASLFSYISETKVKATVKVPVVASGVAGKPKQFLDAAKDGSAVILLAASVHSGEITIPQLKNILSRKRGPVSTPGKKGISQLPSEYMQYMASVL